MLAAANLLCKVKGALKLNVKVRTVKCEWTFLIMEDMGYHCILGTDFTEYTGMQVIFQMNQSPNEYSHL